MRWMPGLRRSLNISNPLEMPPEMLVYVYVSSITVRDFPVSRNSYPTSETMIKFVYEMMMNTVC